MESELTRISTVKTARSTTERPQPHCRVCNAVLTETFADLGVSPLANSFLTADQLRLPELFYPLHAYVCSTCLLVQLEEIRKPTEIFTDYAYFSSYSTTWIEHCRQYAEEVIQRLRLERSSNVVEVASNDGYLLQFFVQAGIPVLGVEPAENVARAAITRGIPTEIGFFDVHMADQLRARGFEADLIIANNVLAHVPDVHSFVAGIHTLLRPGGICTVEFPHVLNLIHKNQFDTIYHEHYSYLSLHVVERLFQERNLRVFDVRELTTHGGSLRVYGCRTDDASHRVEASVQRMRTIEREAGLHDLATYLVFADRVNRIKLALWEFLIGLHREGKSIAGYGAPAKGNTLLNYCGIGRDLLPYTVDRSSYKQGLYLPGTRIPIEPPERLAQTKPDYIVILPWNLRDEIIDQLPCARSWGARFVIPIPKLEVVG